MDARAQADVLQEEMGHAYGCLVACIRINTVRTKGGRQNVTRAACKHMLSLAMHEAGTM